MSNELNNDLINTNTNIDELQTEEDHDITMMDENISDNITQEQQHPYLNGHVYLPIISNIGDSLDKLEYDSRLLYIAESNDINISWEDIQLIIRDLILKQCDIMIEKISDSSVLSTINNIKISILHCIDQHTGIPFTIQRICELITSPSKHYNSFVKYLNAVEKVLSVVSTWETYPETTPTVSGINSNFLFASYDFAEVKYTPIDNNEFEEEEEENNNNVEMEDNNNTDQENSTNNDQDQDNSEHNDQENVDNSIQSETNVQSSNNDDESNSSDSNSQRNNDNDNNNNNTNDTNEAGSKSTSNNTNTTNDISEE